MYRISDELAKEIIIRIKSPEFDSVGNTAFLPKTLNSIGLIDPVCCIGSMFHYILESPKPLIFPNAPFNKAGIDGYFLYRKEELMSLEEPWEISRVFVDPTSDNPDEKIDVRDSSIVLPTDIEKLTIPVTHHIKTMEELITKEPLIMDCLNMEKNYGRE